MKTLVLGVYPEARLAEARKIGYNYRHHGKKYASLYNIV
jgi:hypothetical protein